MISAIIAREIQAKGVPQEEYLHQALDRAEQAIVDTARKGESWVKLAVFRLTTESFSKLVDSLTSRGFACTDIEWGDHTSRLMIRWGQA